MRLSLFILCVFSSLSLSVSMNFTGNWRFRASNYGNLGLGSDGETTKAFLGSRLLLLPNLVVDDHFSVKGQWSLLASPQLSPDPGVALGAGNGDYILGDVTSQGLVLNRAWLEWMSDFGVMRLGRMPVSWGYGLVYDAGNNAWDDWQSTWDRLEYRLHLGNVVGALAYTKGFKGSTLGNTNDQEFYSIYLQYNNQESETEGGILYEKQTRSQGQGTALTMGPSQFPYKQPSTVDNAKQYPLSKKVPHPLDNHLVDLYLKKTVGYFTFGGEVAWLTGNAVDYDTANGPDALNAVSVMLSGTYEYHKVKGFLEVLFAQGDNNLSDGTQNGFVLLHRNRSPGLILGRELLGPYNDRITGFGSHVIYGNEGSYSGVFFLRSGAKVEWSSTLSSGAELIISQKATSAAGESAFLGVEIDVGTEYKLYKNLDLGINAGYLFPGPGLRVENPKGAFAVQGTAALKF